MMGEWRGALGALLALIVAIAAPPARADDISAVLNEGERLFARALEGDKRALRQAWNHFRSAAHKVPGHPLVSAYQGALLALKGREASRKVERERYTEQALARLDAAMSALPRYRNDVVVVMETRLLVARTLARIPPLFSRLTQARRILDAMMEDELFDAMPEAFRARVYMSAAEFARRQGDDSGQGRYLARLVELMPATAEAREARSMLRRLGGL